MLLKDNIATADAMQTTAGSLALLGSRPPRDAFIVARLRAAGAVILGKTNLSEWANIRSTRSTSGWSARGGLTSNPYALDRNTSGSSSGSGAAIAASLATLAVGTETDGSIVSPSSINGLVGVKPTVGLVSRSGIIPICPVAGHRRPDDAHGPRRGAAAHRAGRQRRARSGDRRRQPAAPSTTRGTSTRAGSPASASAWCAAEFGGGNDLVSAVVEAELEVLKAAGATLVDVPELPGAGRYDGGRARGAALRAQGRDGRLPRRVRARSPHRRRSPT